jgi:hypothetical protein
VVSWHLRHLAKFGFVTDWDGAGSRRERGWQAVARGYRFVARDGDTEAVQAARQLDRERITRAIATIAHWLDHEEAALPLAWQQESGLANTRVRLSLAEAVQVEAAIEQVLAPYVLRAEDDQPEDARGVRFLRFVLPEGEAS